MLLQIAHAVCYLHEERGVVHRDIKPENVLLEKPVPPDTSTNEGDFGPWPLEESIGRVALADFGLSKVVWNQVTGTPCGTVGYTAPEIVKDKDHTRSVDIWAMGCILYTMLCGFPPFYDEDVQALTDKVARGEYTFLSPWWDPISPKGIPFFSLSLVS